MKYFLEIDLDNAAFAEFPGVEVARILRDAADRVAEYKFNNPPTQFPLRDFNGNRVGSHGYRRTRTSRKPHGQTRALKHFAKTGDPLLDFVSRGLATQRAIDHEVDAANARINRKR